MLESERKGARESKERERERTGKGNPKMLQKFDRKERPENITTTTTTVNRINCMEQNLNHLTLLVQCHEDVTRPRARQPQRYVTNFLAKVVAVWKSNVAHRGFTYTTHTLSLQPTPFGFVTLALLDAAPGV